MTVFSSGKGHKHPVYAMCLARRSSGGTGTGGTSSGSSSGGGRSDWLLVTASTDGLLCHWDLDNLTEPVSSTLVSSTVIPPSIVALQTNPNTAHELTSSIGGSSVPTEDVGSMKASGAIGSGAERPISVSCMALGAEEDERKVSCDNIMMHQVPHNLYKKFERLC